MSIIIFIQILIIQIYLKNTNIYYKKISFNLIDKAHILLVLKYY